MTYEYRVEITSPLSSSTNLPREIGVWINVDLALAVARAVESEFLLKTKVVRRPRGPWETYSVGDHSGISTCTHGADCPILTHPSAPHGPLDLEGRPR